MYEQSTESIAASEAGDLRTIARLLTHPAVSEATIVRDRSDRIAYISPRPAAAPVLARACEIEDNLALGLGIFDVEEILPLAGVNRSEAEFLFSEIESEDCYGLLTYPALPSAPVIVDIGANIGAFATIAALHYPGAHVLAVEPVPLLCEAIEANAVIHALDVETVKIAVTDFSGAISLNFYPFNTVMSGVGSPGSAATDALRDYLKQRNPDIDGAEVEILIEQCLAPDTIECRCEPLTRVLLERKIERVDLLKIDAEHSELSVLRGIDDATWTKIDRVAVEVHDVDQRLAVVRRLLETRGFEFAARGDALAQTGCWMAFGRKVEIDTQTSCPIPLTPSLTRSGLSRELAECLRTEGERPPDRIRVVSARRLRKLCAKSDTVLAASLEPRRLA